MFKIYIKVRYIYLLMTTKFTTNKNNKRKRDYFNAYNIITKEMDEVKYLSQQELAEGWRQVIPNRKKKNLIHFNITLPYLPEYLWNKLNKVNIDGEKKYCVIKDG